MNATPSPEDVKRRVLATFNGMAPTYDDLLFVQVSARHLLELVDLQPGMRVLDVGTGTGLVAMAAAQIVGSAGKVVGIDLSPEMISRARAKLTSTALTNLEFHVGDAEKLDFSDGSFDAVLYASSLFFVPDMLGALREARRVLTAGGWVAFTSFAAGFMHPLRELLESRMEQYGMARGPRPDVRLLDPSSSEKLLHDTGFERINVHTEPLGYYLPDAEARWQEILVSLDGKALHNLPPSQLEQIKAEHLEELGALTTSQGIWFPVPTNFALGWK